MANKIKTPLRYKTLFAIGRMLGFNVLITHDAGFTKYTRRIEIHL